MPDKLLVAGPAPELAFVLEEHREPIRRYILSLTRDAAEAEDLTQETIVRAFTRAESLRDVPALKSWLYRIATNVCYDRFRQSAYRHRAIPLDALSDLASRIPWGRADEPRLDSALEQAEMSDCVHSFIEVLPDTYRGVLLLHDLEGLPNARIAQMLGISLDLVKMRLHRARRRLKAALEAGCEFSHDDRGVLVCEPAPSAPRE